MSNPIYIKQSKLIATHSFTVFPQDLNYSGSLFGGTLMQHMDLAGGKVVRRVLYCTESDGYVTASVDRIDFNKPAFLGDLIIIESKIKSIGTSSFKVKISVIRESLKGETEEICDANFTFVAMKNKAPYKHNLKFESFVDS